MDNFTKFSYLRLVLASFLLESSYHCSGFFQHLSGVLHFFNSVPIDLVSIEYTFSHHPSVGVVQGFGEMNWGDEIRTVVRVALSWKKSFTFDTGYSVSLKYRNHLGCRAGYLGRVLPTKSCERFESSLLHSVSQVPSLCLTLPLFPSRIGRAHENLHLHLTTKELACGHDLTCRVLWVRSVPEVLHGVSQKCRKSTLLEVVHESPCFHICRLRSNVGHLDITTR
jgi:hypothetical protein